MTAGDGHDDAGELHDQLHPLLHHVQAVPHHLQVNNGLFVQTKGLQFQDNCFFAKEMGGLLIKRTTKFKCDAFKSKQHISFLC